MELIIILKQTIIFFDENFKCDLLFPDLAGDVLRFGTAITKI